MPGSQHVILIDNISPNKKFAWTTDAVKIAENRNLLKQVPFAHSLKIEGTNGGTVSLFSVGRFIAIVKISAEGTPTKMYFFDFDWEISAAEFRLLLPDVYSEKLEKEWFDIQWKLYSAKNDNSEIVRLSKDS